MPYGAGKEQRLTHGGKVVKREFGNFGRILGNSDSKSGVGKNIGDEDTENGNPELARVSKTQTKILPDCKPNLAMRLKKST